MIEETKTNPSADMNVAEEQRDTVTNTNAAACPDPDELLLLKAAGEEFQCASSSLKNNIKDGKLAGTKESEKAPFKVRRGDAERFLRDTPGIASRFHPKNSMQPVKDGPSLTGLLKDNDGGGDTGGEASGEPETMPSAVEGAAAATPVATAARVDACEPDPTATAIERPPVPETPAVVPSAANKRKRRRRRSRGAKPQAQNEVPEFGLRLQKALEGTSAEERLRLTVCLKELAGIVASA